jgi:Predicted membrane protein
MMINKWTTERVLTNERYIQKIGWISRDTEEMSLDRIEEVNLNQSLLGRILGFGTVEISGTGSGKITLRYIDNPLIFQKHLNNQRFQK